MGRVRFRWESEQIVAEELVNQEWSKVVAWPSSLNEKILYWSKKKDGKVFHDVEPGLHLLVGQKGFCVLQGDYPRGDWEWSQVLLEQLDDRVSLAGLYEGYVDSIHDLRCGVRSVLSHLVCDGWCFQEKYDEAALLFFIVDDNRRFFLRIAFYEERGPVWLWPMDKCVGLGYSEEVQEYLDLVEKVRQALEAAGLNVERSDRVGVTKESYKGGHESR